MAFVTRESARQARPPQKRITVPDWGGDLIVRGLRGVERDDLRFKIGDPAERKNLTAVLAVTCCLTEEGKQLFTAADEMDLGLGPSRPLEHVWNAVMELSGIGETATAALEKNSEPTPSAATGTATPPPSAAP